MSQSPKRYARSFQPVLSSSFFVYPESMNRLSSTVAKIKRVSVSEAFRAGVINRSLNQTWPMFPGLVVAYIRGRQFDFDVRFESRRVLYLARLRVVASSMTI